MIDKARRVVRDVAVQVILFINFEEVDGSELFVLRVVLQRSLGAAVGFLFGDFLTYVLDDPGPGLNFLLGVHARPVDSRLADTDVRAGGILHLFGFAEVQALFLCHDCSRIG